MWYIQPFKICEKLLKYFFKILNVKKKFFLVGRGGGGGGGRGGGLECVVAGMGLIQYFTEFSNKLMRSF